MIKNLLLKLPTRIITLQLNGIKVTGKGVWQRNFMAEVISQIVSRETNEHNLKIFAQFIETAKT